MDRRNEKKSFLGQALIGLGLVATAYGALSGLYVLSLPDFDAGVEDAFGRAVPPSGLVYDSLFDQYYDRFQAVNLRAIVGILGLAGIVFGARLNRPRSETDKALAVV